MSGVILIVIKSLASGSNFSEIEEGGLIALHLVFKLGKS